MREEITSWQHNGRWEGGCIFIINFQLQLFSKPCSVQQYVFESSLKSILTGFYLRFAVWHFYCSPTVGHIVRRMGNPVNKSSPAGKRCLIDGTPHAIWNYPVRGMLFWRNPSGLVLLVIARIKICVMVSCILRSVNAAPFIKKCNQDQNYSFHCALEFHLT